MIIKARRLNAMGKNSVSNPMTGSDYLHRLMVKKTISFKMYRSMVRVAEDPSMNYEITI